MKHLLFALILGSAFLVGSCQSEAPDASGETEDSPQAAAPSFTISNTDTLPYPIISNFDELAPIFEFRNDTTYIINFWATWCAPCVEELPYFEQLAEDTKEQPVQIIMVSLDFKRDVRTKLLRFIQDRPFDLPVIALTDGNAASWIDRVDPEWSGAIPVTIVYHNDKRVFFGEQFEDYEQLAGIVAEVSQG